MKTFTALVVACLVFAAARVPVQSPGSAKIADKVAAQARPFRLDEVKLLDGPFRDAMIRDQEYLLSLDEDRLLHTFRLTAGLPTTAQPLGGWELPDVELRGHAVGHYLSAVSIMYASTGDARFKRRADSLVAEFAKVQAAESTKFHPGLPLGVSRRALRSRGRAAARVGAVLHHPQDHGGPARRVSPGRQRAGAGGAEEAGRLGGCA